MNNPNTKWILIFIAWLVTSVAIFFFGKSTVDCPVITASPDSVVTIIDTCWLPSEPIIIKEYHTIEPKPDTVEVINPDFSITADLMYEDSLNINHQNLTGIVYHTVISNAENTFGLWDMVIEAADPVLIESTETIKEIVVEKLVPVDMNFYENHWFWTWLTTLGAVIAALIGAI